MPYVVRIRGTDDITRWHMPFDIGTRKIEPLK